MNKTWWHPDGKPEPNEWDHETMTIKEPYRETDERFHIGQMYEKKEAALIECRDCGGRSWEVGRGSYFTAIRCVNCRWEYCIHDG